MSQTCYTDQSTTTVILSPSETDYASNRTPSTDMDRTPASPNEGSAILLKLKVPVEKDVGQQKRIGSSDSSHHVQWESGTTDNEFLGKKKSKVCCIYHKPKEFGESSSESSSSDEGNEEKKKRKKRRLVNTKQCSTCSCSHHSQENETK